LLLGFQRPNLLEVLGLERRASKLLPERLAVNGFLPSTTSSIEAEGFIRSPPCGVKRFCVFFVLFRRILQLFEFIRFFFLKTASEPLCA
jgi:hypothetical protein